MKPRRILISTQQRLIGTRIDGNVAPANLGDIERVASRLFYGHVARDRGDRDHLNVGRAQRHDQRDGIVGSSVGVDQEGARHAAYDSKQQSAILSLPEVLHVSHRALRPDSGEDSPGRPTAVVGHQEGHDRQAPQADRAGREEESQNPLPAGTLLRPVLLRRAEHALVRTDRARARRARPPSSCRRSPPSIAW